METLRDKSKRLLKQVQSDTEQAIKELVAGDKFYTAEDQRTIIDIHLLSLNDDIMRIKWKLEDLVANQSLRPDVRKDILDVIALLS